MEVKPQIFVFDAYSFDRSTRTAFFTYRYLFENAAPITFTERIVFDEKMEVIDVPEDLLAQLLRTVHLTLGISYYKAYCPERIEVTYPLSRAQAEHWNTIYTKGLGEFFCKNDIDFHGLVQFPFEESYVPSPATLQISHVQADRALVGMGGGKDSLVSAMLLRAQGQVFANYVLETGKVYPVVENVIALGDEKTLRVRRILDEKILKPEMLSGSYNGHIPISAVYGAVGALSAAIHGYRWVIVSNEHSANEGNRVYHGEEVNHQWSKSAEFEQMFQDYMRMYVTPDIVYFSLLRPFHEIRIVQMFVQMGQDYFDKFSSCNRNFSTARPNEPGALWCGACPKCAFVFLLFAAFLSRAEIVRIFGKNLFADATLIALYRDLLGLGDAKPFDCVGTFDESRTAFVMARERFAGDAIIEAYVAQIAPDDARRARVFGTQSAPKIPAQFVLAGMRSALILGYSIEGHATEAFLRERYPEVNITIADKKDDEDYLTRQRDVDIVIKTPGIPQRAIAVHHTHFTTATNLFFAHVKGRQKIIGITGTKGKSTVASLTHAMLVASGIDVRLVGNIGTPMLAALSEDSTPETVFVVELSSYQLETLQQSPDIAVALNLFPEHMDHHGSAEAYYSAKKNITAYQSARDVFIYNDADARLAMWADETQAHVQTFAELTDAQCAVNPLPGAHNEMNVRAALAAARAAGATPEGTLSALRDFALLPHRLEHVATVQDIAFYDDAISTTPESTIAALSAIENVETLFLGGLDRGYDYTALSEALAVSSVRNLVLFPETGARITVPANIANVLRTESMDEAVAFAFAHTHAGNACLLSPGAPSYNLYKNFAERGDTFASAVRNHEDN